jgi:hypothetical protein
VKFRIEIGAIRQLLRTEWDPLGVGDEPGALDEYDSCAGRLFAMTRRGASAEELADFLACSETEMTGGAPDLPRANRVVGMLLRSMNV